MAPSLIAASAAVLFLALTVAAQGTSFIGGYRGTCVHTVKKAVYQTGFIFFPNRPGFLYYAGTLNGTVGGCSYSVESTGGAPDALNATLTKDVDWAWGCEATIEMLLIPNPDGHGAHLYLNDGATQFAECDVVKVVAPQSNSTTAVSDVSSKGSSSEAVAATPVFTGVYTGHIDTTVSGDMCQLPFITFFLANQRASGSTGAFWAWGFCGELIVQCAYLTPSAEAGKEAHSYIAQYALQYGSRACPVAVAASMTLDDSGTVVEVNAHFQAGSSTIDADGVGDALVLGTY